MGRTRTSGVRPASRPVVAGIVRVDVAAAWMFALPAEVAAASRGRGRCEANVNGPVVIAIGREAPGSSVTWPRPAGRLATRPAGPPTARLNVSATVPVLVTVIVNVVPGGP